MTRGASSLGVRTVQRELGHSVVKGIRVEANNVGVASLMIRVAMFALGARDVRNGAVETPSPANIRRDVLVANETQIVLPILLKYAVALLAIRFNFRVTLDDRSR
jgi:hypothetical protein